MKLLLITAGCLTLLSTLLQEVEAHGGRFRQEQQWMPWWMQGLPGRAQLPQQNPCSLTELMSVIQPAFSNPTGTNPLPADTINRLMATAINNYLQCMKDQSNFGMNNGFNGIPSWFNMLGYLNGIPNVGVNGIPNGGVNGVPGVPPTPPSRLTDPNAPIPPSIPLPDPSNLLVGP